MLSLTDGLAGDAVATSPPPPTLIAPPLLVTIPLVAVPPLLTLALPLDPPVLELEDPPVLLDLCFLPGLRLALDSEAGGSLTSGCTVGADV